MRRRRWSRFAAPVVAVGVASTAAGLALQPVSGQAERWSVDARFAVRGHRAPPRDVVVVAVDNATLRRLNVRPPFPRDLQAKVIDNLDRAGARVVAYDFSLELPTADPERDRTLALSLMNARHAVVSVTAPGRDGSIADLAGAVPMSASGVRPGATLLRLDPDGVVRRFPARTAGIEPFPLAAANAFSGRPARVPAGALVDYPGPSRTVAQLSYVDVLAGAFPAALVRGRIVVVGPTAPVLGDGHRVPLDSTMPGPEIHAAAIDTVLRGFPLRMAAPGTNLVATLLAGFAVPVLLAAAALGAFAVRRRRRGAGVPLLSPGGGAAAGAGVASLVAWLAAVQLAFAGGTVIAVVPGLAAIGLASAVSGVMAARATRRERRMLRRAFVADGSVAAQVLAGPARRRTMTSSDIVGGYEIVAPLAHGGMGEVFHARQTRLDRPVALKLIRPEHTGDRRARRRFVAEAHNCARISHPHVVPILDAGEADGVLFIAMQLIDGGDLARSVASLGPLDTAFAVRLIHGVAGALDASHAAGVVHRDVTPANVLVAASTSGHAYLTDFGIAGAMAEGTARGPRVGTPGYLAPERVAGRDGGPPGDVYGLAATFFYCVTGRSPAAGEDPGGRTPAASTFRPGLPPALDAVLAAGLAADPAERPPTATALSRRLAAALGVPLEPDEERAAPAPHDVFPATTTHRG